MGAAAPATVGPRTQNQPEAAPTSRLGVDLAQRALRLQLDRVESLLSSRLHAANNEQWVGG